MSQTRCGRLLPNVEERLSVMDLRLSLWKLKSQLLISMKLQTLKRNGLLALVRNVYGIQAVEEKLVMARPEETVEKEFVKQCKRLGVTAHKFEIAGTKGAPDRIIFLPDGQTLFVEFKRPNGGNLSEHQIDFINHLKRLHHKVIVTDEWEYPLEIVKRLLGDYEDEE
jgi:hypothetical protein